MSQEQETQTNIIQTVPILPNSFHKELPTQTNDQQSYQFVKDYNEDVIYQNSLWLILYLILIYLSYIGVELVSYNIKSNDLSQYEQKYLIDLQTYTEVELRNRIQKIKMFVDIYRELTSMDYNTSNNQGSIPCDQNRYFCINSCYESVSNSVENQYALIKHNYEKLIYQPGFAGQQVFLYYPNLTNSLLIYKFGNQPKNPVLAYAMISYLKNFNKKEYLVKTLKYQYEKERYQIKLVICGIVPKISAFAKICVIGPKNMESKILQKQNPMRIIDEHMVIVPYVGNPHQIQMQVTQQQSQIIQEITSSSANNSDKAYFESFHFSQCVKRHSSIQFLIKNKVTICNGNQLVYFLAPITAYSKFSLQFYLRYHLQDLQETGRAKSYSLKFMIFSNRTFFQNQSARIKFSNKKQGLCIQLVVLVGFIWLAFMNLFPQKLIRADLCFTIALLIKMSKSVKMIKNKDDLQQQSEVFNKLNLEISKKTHIFYSTIQYFKYFIWYRKWIYTTNSAKRKALLDEGLTLFGSSDYAPVLMYIYTKEIQRESKLAENYKKMRKIFTQKFIVFQNQQKIQGSINIKSRAAARKIKKSGFGKSNQEQEIQNKFERQQIDIMQQSQKMYQSRINKQLDLLQINKKNKRYVRFSNDLQEQQKPMEYRVSKFLLPIPQASQSKTSIMKDSQKSIQQQLKKKEEQDVGSNVVVQSSKEERNLTENRQVVTQINTEDGDQKWDYEIKFDQADEQNSIDQQQQECLELKKFSLKKLDERLSPIYQHIVNSYKSMIIIKKMYLDSQSPGEIYQYINQLYRMEIQKLRFTYKFIKHKNKQRQKILKQLSRKLISLKKQKRVGKQFDVIKKSRALGSEKWLQQTISVIEQQIIDEVKYIDIEFKNFNELEQTYKIDTYLLERSKLYQIKLMKILNYPIPYKKLQSLCDSIFEDIRVEGKVILASQYFHISPHADFEVVLKIQENLLQNHTTHVQKQKTLKLIKKVLRNREIMSQQQSQIELIKNFYNYVHKKFYFIADFSDSYDVFRPILAEIYKNMGQVDLFQILNLAMNENINDMLVSGSQIKPTKLADFEIIFQNLHSQITKNKSVVSAKISTKKLIIEKDFHRILSKIQSEDINLSKFIVLILGGQNQTQSKTHDDVESSSAQNRQCYQAIHQQILSKIDKNYFHTILIGFNLRDYQTKQGKLKKYMKHSHDLVQIDLSKAGLESQLKELSKCLTR